MPSSLTVLLVSLLLTSTAVAFWLWLVILPARVAILCPEGCECGTVGYKVKCTSLSVNPIPLIHLTDVRTLDISYTEITLLEKNSFVSMNGLDLLNADGCGLRRIELGAFNGLTKLTKMGICCNSISEIIPGTFECMNNLENLDLSFNKLQHLGTGVFSGLGNLQYIDLSQNKLQYFHPDTFLVSPNLQNLNLDFNRGLHVSTDRNFINSHSLSHLYISACNISSVSVETFINVSALELINLSYNKLRNLDINILRSLPKLSEMYLNGNPLQCDCQLQEVWRWCEVRNIQTVDRGDVPECEAPIVVKGMWWGVLEKGQCLEGNIQYYGDYKNKNSSYQSKVYPDTLETWYEYDIEFLKQYQVPIYVFPIVFGTTGNAILLIIIICNKDMQTVPNMYIINLAINDIIYLTVLFSEACAIRTSDTWLSGEFMCIFFPFPRRLSVGLSAYSVALYSIHRYRVTVKPLNVLVSSPPTWRKNVLTFCGVWILAALFAVPSTLSRILCLGEVSDNLVYYHRVVIFELLVTCVLPLCVIAFTYTMTARHLVESSRSMSARTQNSKHKTRRNTANVVVGLTFVFLISYVPYHVFWTYFICSQGEFFLLFYKSSVYPSHYKFQYVYLISNFFLLISPCLNPVALFCTSCQFRQILKRYLTFFWKTNSPSNDLELASIN